MQLNSNKKKNEISIRSSAAEYLTYVAAVGDDKNFIEVRYEDGKYMAYTKNARNCLWS